jgi:hypothetical protein
VRAAISAICRNYHTPWEAVSASAPTSSGIDR